MREEEKGEVTFVLFHFSFSIRKEYSSYPELSNQYEWLLFHLVLLDFHGSSTFSNVTVIPHV